MTRSRPTPKIFDTNEYKELINSLNENMPELEFERRCEPIVYDILQNYEGFEKIENGPDFQGTPFDFFGLKNAAPYIIEFKGSLKSFNTPGETQKRRIQEILNRIEGLNVALLQVKLTEGKYRIFYNDELEILFRGKRAPIKPIVEWIKKRM